MTGAIFTPLIPILLVVGVFADWQHGVEWAGNLALFISWVLSVLCFFGLLIKYDDWLKSDRSKSHGSAAIMATRTGMIVMVLMQVAAGWIWTPSVLAALMLLSWAKFAEFKKRRKGDARCA